MGNKYLISSIMFMVTGLVSAQELELLGIVSHKEEKYIGIRLDCGNKTFKSFSVTKFNMESGHNTSTDNALFTDYGNGYYILPVQTDSQIDNAFTVQANFSDNSSIKTANIQVSDGSTFKWLGSEIKWTNAKSGYPGITIDSGRDGHQPFYIDGKPFYKSINTHAEGFFEFSFPQDTPFERFYIMYGIEDRKSNGDVRFSLFVNDSNIETKDIYSKTNPGRNPDGPFLCEYNVTIDNATKIKMHGGVIDNYDSDHMNFVMGRVYYKQIQRKEQTLDLPESQILASDKPFAFTIEKSFTSGLEPMTRIVKGNEYATINGLTLNINSIPADKNEYIEVEIFQPGNKEYAPSQLYRCKYYIRNYKTVGKDEKLVLENGEEVDILTVYGDFKSAGQVIVESGFAKINKLILKYTFVPGKWNFISFPGNFNINEISNLNELGYFLNKSPKAYYIREYSTKARAEGESAWTKLTTPEICRNKGYIMGVSRSSDNPNSDPVEVTFTIDNTTLGVTSTSDGTMNVQLDMTTVPDNEEVEVVVKPVDIKGVPLVVKVKFEPDQDFERPLNFKEALDDARITFNPNKSGIRISLPEDTPAKVIIFDKKGKMIKAIKYISPFIIDISDMKKGIYDVLIQYGNARKYKSLIIE